MATPHPRRHRLPQYCTDYIPNVFSHQATRNAEWDEGKMRISDLQQTKREGERGIE